MTTPDNPQYGDLALAEFHMDLVPLDADLLSLELPLAFRENFLDGDRSSLFYVARALMKLQRMFGVIPDVRGKGVCAKVVCDMLERMRREEEADPAGGAEAGAPPMFAEIDSLVLLDRSVDLVTPLCTQLTYEGIIDEMFGVNSTVVTIEPEAAKAADAAAAKKAPAKRQKIPLNSNDRLFKEVRDMNLGIVGPFLDNRRRVVDAQYKEYRQKSRENKQVSVLKEVLKALPGLQADLNSLEVHIGVASRILTQTKGAAFVSRVEQEQMLLSGSGVDASARIEQLIAQQAPIEQVLRLMCLMSLTQNGIKPKLYDSLRREVLHTYGFEHMFSLQNLEKLGMLKSTAGSGRNSFKDVRKQLKLIREDVSIEEPNDLAYVYSGYAPITARMLQVLERKGSFDAMDDSLKTMPGPAFAIRQPDATSAARDEGRKPVRLVFFLGGCTFTEISAVRWLAAQESSKYQYIVATTSVINGRQMVDSVLEGGSGEANAPAGPRS